MSITLKTRKILWLRSGGRCAICKNEVIVDSSSSDDDPSVVADEAHIIARKESFTRGDYDSLSPEQRDQYGNLILLCKIHHKVIDDLSTFYTVDKLHEIKAAHEDEVRSKWTDTDAVRIRDEEVYSGYIDQWAKMSDLDNWQSISSWVNADDTPTIPRLWYDSSREFLSWVIARIWPRRYPALEKALLNYKAVLLDFINVFDKHIDQENRDDRYIYTERYYKVRTYESEVYDRLVKDYEDHTALVCDLFFELTRAANYVCDQVRQHLFAGYRLKEGALLILRGSVGFELQTIRARVEYRGKERTETPYPGLKLFKSIRYTRDYAIDQEPMRPPTEDESGA